MGLLGLMNLLPLRFMHAGASEILNVKGAYLQVLAVTLG